MTSSQPGSALTERAMTVPHGLNRLRYRPGRSNFRVRLSRGPAMPSGNDDHGSIGPDTDGSELFIHSPPDFTGRSWLFRALDRWLGQADERRLLIIGGPGTGKSTLSVRLVEMSNG